jgi:hypothetical protein
MLIIKGIAFVIFAVVALVILFKNLANWSEQFQKYQIRQANQVFGDSEGWDDKWGQFMSKAMVIFFGLTFIGLIYVVVFSAGAAPLR